MKNREDHDKKYTILNDIPMEIWLLDKRIINRFFTPQKREAVLQGLTCLKCGKKCGGQCEKT
jgi:hypothetical protein